MAPSGFASFLLFLGLMVSNAYGVTECDNILNTFINNSSSNFNFTISPTTLTSRTEYTVHLEGQSNFTKVLFQAVAHTTPEGTWSNASVMCNGSALFNDPFGNSTKFQATWLSPDNVTSITIYAYIYDGTNTSRVHQTLSQVIVNTTTEAPTTTGNKTEPTKTSGTATVSTHSTQTTAAGSIQQSSLLSMALSVILGLLLIPNKYLP